MDAIFPELKARIGFRRPYLKLDTQGFDLQVMQGGLDSLCEIVGFQTEASIRPIYEGMPDYRDAIRFGNERGFEISGMFPVSLDNALRMIEFDCVFVNGQKLNSPGFSGDLGV